MEDDRGFNRRLPSIERKISEIKPEDMRVSVTGMLIDLQESGNAMVDDGTGKLNITFDEPEKIKDMCLNKPVRVMGRLIPLERGFELQGEIVQDMEGLDMELKGRVDSLEISSEQAR
jgi:hypothetical protein